MAFLSLQNNYLIILRQLTVSCKSLILGKTMKQNNNKNNQTHYTECNLLNYSLHQIQKRHHNFNRVHYM